MDLALIGLRVWDGRAQSLSPEPWTIRIREGKIEGLGPQPELAANAQGIPLSGATAIPGLIDAHVHLTLDPALSNPSDQLSVPRDSLEKAVQSRAAAMLCAGITTARDLGGGEWLELEVRDRILRGEALGPRLLCAGQPLTSPDGHCHFWGGAVRDPSEIPSVVRRQVEHGVDWIKVMATGGVITRGTQPASLQFAEEELAEIVREAAVHQRYVAAHCHGTSGIRHAARAGVRTIEHCSFFGAQGFGGDFDPALVDEMAARVPRLWVAPTVNSGWAKYCHRDGKSTEFGTRMGRVLRGLAEAGVSLIASTDAGIPGVHHDRLAESLEVLARLTGLAPVEVLRAATSEAAEALGIADTVGTLAPGRSADVLVVAGNPLEDLEVLTRPRLVVARGQVVARNGSLDSS